MIHWKSSSRSAKVLPGKYSVKVVVAGFDAVNQPLIVRDGEPLTANAQLKLATAKEEGE